MKTNFTTEELVSLKEIYDSVGIPNTYHDFLNELQGDIRVEVLDLVESIEMLHWMIQPASIRGYAKDRPRDEQGRIIVDITKPHILEDMDYFRQPAIHFQKYGKYTNLYPNPHPKSEYRKFWDEETRRCKEGYVRESDGEWIPGYYYFYLNYFPIMRTKETGEGTRAERVYDFVDVWDSDYMFFHYVEQGESNSEYGAVLKTRGRGYEQPHSSIIKTPYGDTTMGEIQIGDLVLTPTSREYATVVDKFSQGVKDVYEVTFSDGSKVECGLNHLWPVYKNYSKSKKTRYKVLSLKEIIEDGLYYNTSQKQKVYKYKLPKIYPVSYPLLEKELPIHPYLLGALLGDGSMSTGSIKIASSDKEVLNNIQKILGEEYELVYDDTTSNNYRIVYKKARTDFNKNNPLKTEIIKLGINKNCKNKFIPEIYKRASIPERMWLIKGLMDTDGSVNKQGNLEFTNTNETLIDDVADVFRSLGIICKKDINDRSGQKGSFVNEREIKRNKYFRLYIRSNANLFTIKRKSERIRQKEIFDLLSIVDIKKVRQEESSCIMIDSEEHVYLTNHFIPTHNSFKDAAMLDRNFYHFKKSKGFAFASESEYLTKDGILNKAWDGMDFLDEHTPWSKLRQKKDTMGHKRASYIDQEGKEKGYMSEIIEVTTKGNPEKGRGKRGKLLIHEEAGIYPGLLQTWNIARPSIEDGDYTFGYQIAFGTGGTLGAKFEGLEELFYRGGGYKVRMLRNVWDKVKGEGTCGYFVPEYMNRKGCYDENGNSDVLKALAQVLIGRKKIRENASKENALTQEKAERPITPQEAVMRIEGSLFPVDELKGHLESIMPTLNQFVANHYIGKLQPNADGILSFSPSADAKVIREFPLKDNLNKHGAIEIYEMPQADPQGVIPRFRYISGIDPIDDDSSTTNSLASIFIMDILTDRIVAEYTGRPRTANEFYEIVYRLLKFYNAIANYENDKKGLYAYFNQKNALTYLAPNPQILKDIELVKATNLYGNKALGTNSGVKINAWGRRLQADWMLEPAYGEEKTGLLNLHKIRSIGYLKEAISWNQDGNFDRVSAMGMLMILREEYKKYKLQINESMSGTTAKRLSADPFFDVNFGGKISSQVKAILKEKSYNDLKNFTV